MQHPHMRISTRNNFEYIPSKKINQKTKNIKKSGWI